MTHRFVSSLPLAGLAGLLLLAAGCRSNCDLVEAELRSREGDVDRLRAQLYQAECQNNALQRELHGLRQTTVAAPPPELAAQTYAVREIVLGRQTGGYDDDNCPGDEALQVVLEPRDGDGQAVKAPGALRVVALQISPEGLKAPLSTWELSPEQLRRTWRNGLLSTGYYVILPWKAWPAGPKLKVIARFTLADGRLFEAERDVLVRLPPAERKALPGPALVPDDPVPLAPPEPRPLEEPRAPVTGPELAPVQLLRPTRYP